MVCCSDPRRAAQMGLWILLVLVIAGVAGSLEVHFENKDGGFFLKHDRTDPGDRPRPLHHSLFHSALGSSGPRRKDPDGPDDSARGKDGLLPPAPSSSEEDENEDDADEEGPKVSEEGGEAAVLSVDRFAVFQTSRPISVRATYGPFSTKQTVPARYIVPDPVDAPLPPINPAVAVPVPGFPNATSLVATAPAQTHHSNLQLFLGQQPQSAPPSALDLDPSSHNLDISAHLVTPEVPRDAPVLRVLFHTGQQAASLSSSSPGLSPPPSLLPQGDKPARRGGRRQYQQHAAAGSRIPPSTPHGVPSKQPRVCIILYASLEEGRSTPTTVGPLSAACSPDAEEADGACVAQVTIPASWWPPLPPPMPPIPQGSHADGDDILPEGNPPPRPSPSQNPPKMPRVKVHAAFSVFEPRGGEGCVPTPGSRVQIQPVTPIGPSATLVAARAPYRELRADDRLSMLLPHAPLYPLSRVHVPVFITARPGEKVSAFVLRARVKSGVRILGAEPSSARRWTVSVELSPKQTVATVTAFRKDTTEAQDDPGVSTEDTKFQIPARRGSSQHHIHHSAGKKKWGSSLSPRGYGAGNQPRVEEVFSWLLEVDEAAALWEGGKIVWGVRFVRDTALAPPPYPLDLSRGGSGARSSMALHHRGGGGHPYHAGDVGGGSIPVGGEERRKLATRLEIQKDDVQAVLPISKNWEVMNTAILTGKQISQAMKVFIVSQAGKVADVTLQSSCHSGEESVLKVSSSCSSVYVDGTELRGSTNATVIVAYGTHVGLARFTVWVPEMPLEVAVADPRLSQIKGWRVVDDAKSLTPAATPRLISTSGDGKRLMDDGESRRSMESTLAGIYRNWGSVGGKKSGLEQQEQPIQERHICRLRFQQSPVEVYSRFYAQDHDSGRVSYFISRRTWLRVTDLVLALLRVSDTRIASLDGRILQGQSTGRTEVQVLSPISGRVVGAKEVRVGNDKVTILKLGVRVVSGLQLSITPDGSIENGYIAETSITRKLTAQYQEGLLDIDVEFSDGTKTPLRQVSVTDYQLAVDSLDTDVVAFAPMLASPHPRVIAVGEGRGDLLHISLLLPERCPRARTTTSNQSSGLSTATLRRKSPSAMQPQFPPSQPLASAYARVEVHFARPDSALRPDFVQNDGGGEGLGGGLSGHGGSKGSFKGRDGRVPSDLQDILIGIPLKDENDHEPTVQARQHVSNSGGGSAGASSSTAGARSAHRAHMTPLEIGMYVLLGAFCFAIVVFVVSCVVYASRFKEIGPGMGGNVSLGLGGGGLGGSSLGGLGGGGVGVGKLGRGGAAKRESTTNAHDWVWLGRATLERASGMGVGRSFGQSECSDVDAIRITTNPNYREDAGGVNEAGIVSTTVFEVTHDQASRPSIDTSTYCKGNAVRGSENLAQQHQHGNQQNNAGGFVEIDKAWMNRAGGRGGDGLPPTPPPHGLPENPMGFVAESNYDGVVEYKPPVPPHRNIGVARIGPVRTQVPTPGFHEVCVHSALGKESSDVSSPSPPPPPPPKERRSCRKEHGGNHDGSVAPWVGGVRVLPNSQRSDSGSPSRGGAAARHHHHHHHHHKHHKNHNDSSGTEANPKGNIANIPRFQPKASHVISRDSRESSGQKEEAISNTRREDNACAMRIAREDSESTVDEDAPVGHPKQQTDHGDSFRRDLGVVGERSSEIAEPMFVIYADSEASGYSSSGAVQEVGGGKDLDSSQEEASDMSQANIVGNPMFSDPKEFERKRQLLLQSRKFGGQTEVGKTKEQRNLEEGKDGAHLNNRCPPQPTPYKKDVDLDLDLEMDYRKIMEYFDSLKESNA